MDQVTAAFKEHYSKSFERFGANARGVDWADEASLEARYRRMMSVADHDVTRPEGKPTLLDVGCGWGGLLAYCSSRKLEVGYTGIDVCENMIEYARENLPTGEFMLGNALEIDSTRTYDYVVCNGILTLKLTLTIQEMERFARRLIRKMYDLCNHGIAFNIMSNRVNFMVDNLFYKSPVETLAYCLDEISPRVLLDHGYSSLRSGKGKWYEFTVYVYKD